MNKIPRSAKAALKKILHHHQGPGNPDFSSLSDPRAAKGKRYSFDRILRASFCAMLTAIRSLRLVASWSARRGLPISYYALYAVFSRLKQKPFRHVLHTQLKALLRAKALEPQGLPCHTIAIDGKTLYYGRKKLNRFCQKTTHDKSGKVHWHLRVQRAVLTSSPLKPTIDQRPIPAHQCEMSAFSDFIAELNTTYGRGLLDNPILTVDAGMTSFANAKLLDDSGFGFIMALKGNQPELLTAAKSFLANQTPEYTSEWELYKGKRRRVKLFRTFALQGEPTSEHDWTFLRQVWLVQTELQEPKGRSKSGRRKQGKKRQYHPAKIVEERYFLSNVPKNDLKPKQILSVVRGHWGVENGANWTSDVMYHEDESPWCRKGESLLVLSLMRVMGINMMNWLKHRHIRNDEMRGWSWMEWIDWLKERMVVDLKFWEKGHKARS